MTVCSRGSSGRKRKNIRDHPTNSEEPTNHNVLGSIKDTVDAPTASAIRESFHTLPGRWFPSRLRQKESPEGVQISTYSISEKRITAGVRPSRQRDAISQNGARTPFSVELRHGNEICKIALVALGLYGCQEVQVMV